jgi:hypothetical protein
MDRRSEGSLTVENSARSKDVRSRCRGMSFGQYHRTTAERRCDIGQLITFDMLPDDVLLEIFDFYLDEDNFFLRKEKWIALAHVCQCWRSVIFQSRHRLNLRLVCKPNTRVRDTLDIWPPLPLIITDIYFLNETTSDNIIAALEQNDRVCQIELINLTRSQLRYVRSNS